MQTYAEYLETMKAYNFRPMERELWQDWQDWHIENAAIRSGQKSEKE